MMKELAGKKLEGLSLDKLWTLRDNVREILLVRIAEQKHTLEARQRLLGLDYFEQRPKTTRRVNPISPERLMARVERIRRREESRCIKC